MIEFVYPTISGSNGIDTRVGLADALEFLRSGEAEGLVVYRLDRLARDLVLQEQLLAEIRRMGADVFSTSNAEADYLTDDPDDPSRKLIRQVLGAVAEYERAMIAMRLRAGRKRKADGGGFAYGSPPLGFRAEGGELVADETEQRALARVRTLRSQGASLRTIAATLEREEIPTKRGGSHWQPRQVGRIVSRMNREGVRS